ncbi:MAG: ArsR family transcriptional regulator [Cyanobacteria bacterium REEB65]|nr:ArsR family transcriptional regulator [Cyanobacteria bacterium REEB65]
MSHNPNVQQKINEDRRLVILRLLMDYRGALNSSSLESAVRAWGHKYIDRAMVVDDLKWLEMRATVRLEDLGSNVLEVNLTAKGERVATGDEWLTGVARPSGE